MPAQPTHDAPEALHAIAARMPADYNPFLPASRPAGAAASPAPPGAAATIADQIPVDFFEVHHGPTIWLRAATQEDAHRIWQGIIRSMYISEYYGYKYTGPQLQVVPAPNPDAAGPSPIEATAEVPAA